MLTTGALMSSAIDHARCVRCGVPFDEGAHRVVVDGASAHDTCVDWTRRPFPGAPAATDLRRLARRLRALAGNVDLAAAVVDRMAEALAGARTRYLEVVPAKPRGVPAFAAQRPDGRQRVR